MMQRRETSEEFDRLENQVMMISPGISILFWLRWCDGLPEKRKNIVRSSFVWRGRFRSSCHTVFLQ